MWPLPSNLDHAYPEFHPSGRSLMTASSKVHPPEDMQKGIDVKGLGSGFEVLIEHAKLNSKACLSSLARPYYTCILEQCRYDSTFD